MVHSHTAFCSRLRTDYRQTAHGPSRKTAICKVHGLSVSGGGKGKNKTGLDRGFVPFVSWLVEGCEREIQVCTQTQTAIFSVFTQQYLINAFIPLRRIFIKNSSYLKNWSRTTFWSYYCTKCKKSVVFVGFMAVITQDFIQISPCTKGSEPSFLYRNFLFKSNVKRSWCCRIKEKLFLVL